MSIGWPCCPSVPRSSCGAGHTVLVERGAGTGSGLTDEAYAAAGAKIVADAAAVFARADLVVKGKEPQPPELGGCCDANPNRTHGSLIEPGRFREWSDVDLAIEADPPGMSSYLLASLLAERC